MLQNLSNQNSNILCTPPTEDEAKTLQREIDILEGRTTNVENDVSDISERLDNDECRICCNECHINSLYECIAEISPDLSSLTERVQANEENIANLETCPGINCTGTLVQSDIADFATCQKVRDIINACGYTTCTGTLVETDLDPLRTNISNLQSCPGLNCVGTLTEQDIADMETKTHAASTYATITCVDTEKARICNLESCPGLNCVGTLVESDIADMETQTHASATYATKTCVDDVKSRVCTNEEYIAQLQSCPGLNCTGTLVESDLDDYATKACVCTIIDSCCYTTQSCVDSVKARVCINEDCIASLNSCAGLNCIGTVTSVNNVSPVNGNVTLVIPPDLSDQVTCNKNDIATIKEKIPDAASSSNQLADKNWVNSSIETATATFVGTFDDVESLPTTGVDNNDYAFVTSCDAQTGSISYIRYKYSDYTHSWTCEYTINTSGFTADQLAALNSGITDELVDKITDVYDSTITVCFNGTCKGSFNLNQSTDSCIDLGNSIACATNATCFGGCTYSQAKTDIRSGLVTQACLDACGYTTCTGTVSSISLNGNNFTVENGAASLTGFKPATAVTADCANLVKRTATSCNAKCPLALLSGCSTSGGVSIFVDSDNKITYNPSTNTLTTCNLVLSCETSPVKSKYINSFIWTGNTRCTAWDICCFLKCATLAATPTPSIIKFSWTESANNCVCWGTAGCANARAVSLSGGYVEVIGTVEKNLWDDTCSGWFSVDAIIHPRIGAPIRFIACKGTSNPSVATIICESYDSCKSCYAYNSARFNNYEYCEAKADIRSGLVTSKDLESCGYTTCTGTVTNVNTKANSNVPVALSTGTTSVGTSTCCALTFNPATGNLVAPSVNNCKYITVDVGTSGTYKSKYYLIFERTGNSTVYNCPLCLCGNIGSYSSASKNPFEITIDFRTTSATVRGYVCGGDYSINNCWNIIPTWDAGTSTARVYVWLGSENYNAFWMNTSCASFTPATYKCPLTEMIGTQNCCGFWNLLRCTTANCSTCSKYTGIGSYTANSDRPIMIACGESAYECIGKATTCPLTYNPGTGEIKGIQKEVIGSASAARTTMTPGEFELFDGTPYIDLHHNCYTGDYSTRLIDDAQGQFSVIVNNGTGSTTCTSNATYKFCSNGQMCTNGYFRSGCAYYGYEMTKPDNKGWPAYRLMFDVTSWWNASTGIAPKGLVGKFVGYRNSGYSSGTKSEIEALVGYGRANTTCCYANQIHLSYNNPLGGTTVIIPVILHDTTNNKYWIALRFSSGDKIYKFEGEFSGDPESTTWLNATDANGTLPTGWETSITGMVRSTGVANAIVSSDTSRPTSANCEYAITNSGKGQASMNTFLSTSAMTTGKPVGDGYITQFNWDNSNYKTQLYIPSQYNASRPLQLRFKDAGTWGTTWCNLGCLVGTVACATNANCAKSVCRCTTVANCEMPLFLAGANTSLAASTLWVTCADCPQITYNPTTGTLNGKNLSFNNITGCLTRATSSTDPVFETYADECYGNYITCIKQTPEGIGLCSNEVGDWCTNIDLSGGQLSITSMNNDVVSIFCMSPEENLICLAGCCVIIDSNTEVSGDLCVTGNLCATSVCGSVECALKLQPKDTCTTSSAHNPYSLLMIDANAHLSNWCQPTVQPSSGTTHLAFDVDCKALITNNICVDCNVYAQCFIPTCLNLGNCNTFTYDTGIIIGCCSRVFNDGIAIGCCSFADRGSVSIGNNARTGVVTSGGISGDIVIISHIRTESRDLARNSSPHGEIKFYSCVTANTKLCDYLGMQINLLKLINQDRRNKTFGDTKCPLALQGFLSYYELDNCMNNRCYGGNKDVLNIEVCGICSNCGIPVNLVPHMALWGAIMTTNNKRYGTPYCNFNIDCFKERMLYCTTDVSIGGFAGKTYCQYGECTIGYVRDTLCVCSDIPRVLAHMQGIFTLVY